jgi:hypothetical protein
LEVGQKSMKLSVVICEWSDERIERVREYCNNKRERE